MAEARKEAVMNFMLSMKALIREDFPSKHLRLISFQSNPYGPKERRFPHNLHIDDLTANFYASEVEKSQGKH